MSETKKFCKSFALVDPYYQYGRIYVLVDKLLNRGDTLDIQFKIEFAHAEEIEYFEISGPYVSPYKSTNFEQGIYNMTIRSTGYYQLLIQGKGTNPYPTPEEYKIEVISFRDIFTDGQDSYCSFWMAKNNIVWDFKGVKKENSYSWDHVNGRKFKITHEVFGHLNFRKSFFYEETITMSPTTVSGKRTRKLWTDKDLTWQLKYHQVSRRVNGTFKFTGKYNEANLPEWKIVDDNGGIIFSGILYFESTGKYATSVVFEIHNGKLKYPYNTEIKFEVSDSQILWGKLNYVFDGMKKVKYLFDGYTD